MEPVKIEGLSDFVNECLKDSVKKERSFQARSSFDEDIAYRAIAKCILAKGFGQDIYWYQERKVVALAGGELVGTFHCSKLEHEGMWKITYHASNTGTGSKCLRCGKFCI
jgi:hypothetical protein